ncbi:RNA polymerase sigma factor [bacterium]|nr:RNA polymerase sigma factor [bacterium]
MRPDQDENELIRRIMRGDPAAERALYGAHVDRVYRLAFRMTGDAALAEDLTQDTFIRAFDRLEDFRSDGPFGAWLHRIATSVICSALRKRKRIMDFETARDDLAHLSGTGPDLDPDLSRRLDRAVTQLDDDQRLVLVMHDVEGYTHQEIAAAMGTPVGTAKARLSRARRKLRDLLAGPLRHHDLEAEP